MRRVWLCLLLVGIVLADAGCAPADLPANHSVSLPTTATASAQNLHILVDGDPIDTHRLEQSGLGFKPADPNRNKPPITKAEAIARAWKDGPNKVGGGPVTASADLGYFDDRTMVSGVTPDRLVWFVGFTGPGIVEYASGPPGAPHPIGHEYVSIIDATSGEVVTGMTCCVIHDEGVMPFETCLQPPAVGPFSFSCEEALHRAADAARQSEPEMVIQQARIDSLRAELMTYAEADRRLSSLQGPRSTPSQDPDELVWFVTVTGDFRYEGMAAAGSYEHPMYEAKERDYLFGAQTGRQIEEIMPATSLIGR